MPTKIKQPLTQGAAKVPVIMQMEALECGAASLAMVMAYYEKWVPLEQVRVDCGVSRDGSNAKNVLIAARGYGFTAKGYRYEPEDLKKSGKFPCIIHWNFNHFVVLDGFQGGKAVINDPAKGTYKVSMDIFDKSFTGICLVIEPNENFVLGGKPNSVWEFAKSRMKGTGTAVAFVVICTLISSLVGIIQPGFSRIFLDRLLTGQNPDWFYLFLIGLSVFTGINILVSAVETIFSNRINGKMAVIGNTTFLWKVLHKSGIGVAEYYAFTSAYGMVSGAFMAAVGIALNSASIRPVLDMARPIMETVPENEENKQAVTRLSGNIEVSHLTFRYDENMPLVLDDISFKINAGQYVAVVGQSGCGKSTLIRLLLGFEKPQKGAVYYDGKDISTLNLQSLRQHIGSVTQNGSLFHGNIFSNIVICAPWLTMDEAWEAAKIAEIDEDIRQMPMGMHTVISEGSGGISGGQKQRLMIARAVAPKPKVLIFDEATSALDNITQKKVSQALDSLKCTRLVIAHRLSTIRQCDRIIVLDGGHIVEDGTYDELIAKNGHFAELVERQRLDV